MMTKAPWLVGLLACLAASSAAEVVDGRQYHLRSGTNAEWQEFSTRTPDGKRVDLRFTLQGSAAPGTLLIRQYNVKLDWRIELNGARLGNLVLMEEPLVHAVNIPAGTLRNGLNTLAIIPPNENDDVVLGPFTIEQRPPEKVLSDATLEIKVADGTSGQPVPCRITVTDPAGTLSPLRNAGDSTLAIRPGVAYTGNGRARLGLQAGEYVVYASRGFEYGLATQRVSLAAGSLRQLSLTIEREVPTPGLAAADTHIHTFTYARHGDATIEERMLTLAGEGIELPISTEHDQLVPFEPPASKVGVENYFTPVLGCEVTTKAGHFNVFPIQPGSKTPDSSLTDWPRLMQSIRATPGVQVAVLNHPQDVHSGFVPFAATNLNGLSGENLRGFDFTFDAVELINSGALRSDLMEVYRNWFALLNYGYRFSGVGASDSHDVSRFIVGQGRTYVRCDDANPARLDIGTVMGNLREGRSYVSLGLLPLVRVEHGWGPGDLAPIEGEKLDIEVTVLGPRWISADRLELYQNGVVVASRRIDPANHAVEKTRIAISLPRPAFDAHLVAIASGPGVRSPHWAIPRPYQANSIVWNPRVFGSSNPVWLDNDGDGKFTAPRHYARTLVEQHEPQKLPALLSGYDPAIAAQVASLLQAKRFNLGQTDFQEALARAEPFVKQSFLDYMATVSRKRQPN